MINVCAFSFLVIFRLEIIILATREARKKKIGFLLLPEHCCILRLLRAGELGWQWGESF